MPNFINVSSVATEPPPLVLDRRSWTHQSPKDRLGYDGPADEHQRHSFNERASNGVPSGRDVPDVREPMFDDNRLNR